ncbi:hypothetical protein ACVXHA_03100 [Escherichia coli]
MLATPKENPEQQRISSLIPGIAKRSDVNGNIS